MTKLTTFISEHGEVFEGSRAALMREKGIVSRSGFDRKSGAPDFYGDRWMSEDKFYELGGMFTKPLLLLGPITRYGKDWTGKRISWLEAECNTAFLYTHYRNCVEGRIDNVDVSLIPDMQKFIKRTNSMYNVVDNNHDDNPYAVELKQVKKELRDVKGVLNTLNMRDTYAGKFGHVALTDDEVEYKADLSIKYAELIKNHAKVLSKSSKWQSDKINSANDALEIAKYERDHGEPMCPRRQAAMRGELHEYDKSVALSTT